VTEAAPMGEKVADALSANDAGAVPE